MLHDCSSAFLLGGVGLNPVNTVTTLLVWTAQLLTALNIIAVGAKIHLQHFHITSQVAIHANIPFVCEHLGSLHQIGSAGLAEWIFGGNLVEGSLHAWAEMVGGLFGLCLMMNVSLF